MNDATGSVVIEKVIETTLTQAQLDQIEKEVARKLKKDRTFEGGMKQVREKAPFHL